VLDSAINEWKGIASQVSPPAPLDHGKIGRLALNRRKQASRESVLDTPPSQVARRNEPTLQVEPSAAATPDLLWVEGQQFSYAAVLGLLQSFGGWDRCEPFQGVIQGGLLSNL
jgi:hypothetical protein